MHEVLESFFCRIYVIAILMVVLSAANALHTLETPVREALLKPRNFNPHPYSSSNTDEPFLTRHPSNGIYSQAPHQFPPTVPFDVNRELRIPKIKNKFQRENGGISDSDSLFGTTKKQYAFSYTVQDMHSGDDYSHNQQQKNGAVKGTYKVQLPDGRTQVVRYIADENGYRADVSYLKGKVRKHFVPTYEANSISSFNSEHFSPDLKSTIGGNNENHPVILDDGRISSHLPKYRIDELSLENRKSISAKPTYILSGKSTRIDPVEDNKIAVQQNPDFDIQHSVFYK